MSQTNSMPIVIDQIILNSTWSGCETYWSSTNRTITLVELTSKKQNKFLRMLDAILQNDKVLKEIKEMVVANRLLSEIHYVTTVERILKHNLDPSLRCCFVCREYFHTADEYTSYFQKLHGEKFLIVAAVDRFQTSQKFNVLHHYNVLNPVTIFTICNVYHTALIKKTRKDGSNILQYRTNLPLSTKVGEPLYRFDMEWLIHIRQKKRFNFGIQHPIFPRTIKFMAHLMSVIVAAAMEIT
ncbi:uncharacterized protein LOC129780041 isoform X2 [Toxorhynchites rutilus septentrionalis]|uniref:uncharacterized protein LOC129780041 isoform X2 n=1 Tax=Toxorhynchites rutilus septentrionalis TaxID=329112 RepID=UPI00247B0983|nr:uncharacterized protein LOC129780041 isoform X2 [Toxorhynchites rutilus septentrionalis]